MYNFTVNDKEYSFPTEWDEVTLGSFLNIVKLEKTKELYAIDELYFIRLIEVLSGAEDGELDDMSIPELNNISLKVTYLNELPNVSGMNQHMNIDGVDYAFKKDLNSLTTGEYISMKTLQQDREYFEYLPEVLAILLRPAKLVNNKVTGVDEWVQDKFNPNAIQHIVKVLKEQPYTKLVGGVNFFFNGSNQLTTNTKVSSEEVTK
jgi:hypothetical protein